MSNSAQFVNAINSWVIKTKTATNDVIKLTIKKLVEEIVRGTPVGVPETWSSPAPADYVPGTAKGNWIASVDGFTSTFNEMGYTRTEDEIIADAVAVIEVSVGEVFYLTNSAPYINKLEYDAHSLQAPAGMVRINVLKFDLLMEEAARELGLS